MLTSKRSKVTISKGKIVGVIAIIVDYSCKTSASYGALVSHDSVY